VVRRGTGRQFIQIVSAPGTPATNSEHQHQGLRRKPLGRAVGRAGAIGRGARGSNCRPRCALLGQQSGIPGPPPKLPLPGRAGKAVGMEQDAAAPRGLLLRGCLASRRWEGG